VVAETSPRLTVLTYNVLTAADARGPARRAVLRGLLCADVIALQEAEAGLLGPEFTVVDLPGRSPSGSGECLASRFPLGAVHTLDEGCMAAEVRSPLGTVLVVHHRGTFELDGEVVRERQALATARSVEELAGADVPVVLLGDLNATPDSASVRFLTGKQSLDGMSVCYADAWAAACPDDPGHTFTPRNPLVRAGQMPAERGRRIDYVLVRGGAHGPLLDVAGCRLIGTEPVDGVWVSDHFGVLAELRPPDHPPGQWAVT